MHLIFKKTSTKDISQKNTVYLIPNNWDDFRFKTTFFVTLFDTSGEKHDLGEIKIGFVGQTPGWTETSLDSEFESLGKNYFSLGQSVEFYMQVRKLPVKLRRVFLNALRDVVYNEEARLAAKDQGVFNTSLLRGVNYSSITEQFKRILDGGEVLTEFHFAYQTEPTIKRAGYSLSFDVIPGVKPSRNIHVLIGRNGIGKTTLLNGMIASLVEQELPIPPEGMGRFFDISTPSTPTPISKGYFTSVVSVSFSAFDPFTPPSERIGETNDLQYSYIGLKEVHEDGGTRTSVHKDLHALSEDFVTSLIGSFGLSSKRERWQDAITFLESDFNFAEMDLGRLLEIEDQDQLRARAKQVFMFMSSGHAIVLLSITKLVERAEEKTLVIMDEPESHLHPPLLSAFTRALADLLNKINGVAIIATHSPVVLQEVPKSCVWKLFRAKLAGDNLRPDMETFGENVGVLTREVFGLEVAKSGFHDLLTRSVAEGKDYDEIIAEYSNQLGFEGRSLLRALISNRNSSLSAE